MATYSYSQMQVYLSCPRKYRYQYVDKVKVAYEPESPDQLLGNSIHKTMEFFYNKLNVYAKPTLEDMIANFVPRIEDGRNEEMMEGYDKESYLNRGKAYLTMYRNRYAPFDHVTVVGNELQLMFPLDDAGQYIWKGYIDRLNKHGDTFVINDYKTGKSFSDSQRAEYREQMTIYAHGVLQKYPGMAKRIEANIFYMHFDLVDTWEITPELITEVKNKYVALHQVIDQARFNYQMGDQAPFAPIKSPLCTRCKFRHICPLWKHLYSEEVVEEDVPLSTLQALVDTYASNQAQIRELEKENDALKASFLTYARRHDIRVMSGEQFELTFSVTPVYKITNEGVLQMVLEKQWVLDEYTQIDRFAIARACKENMLSIADLHECVEQDMQRSVRARAKKDTLPK